MSNFFHAWMLRILVASVTFSSAASAVAAELDLKKGDHVCLVGNALGERLQHQNYWETQLYQRFPDMDLVVRNLCFPGDEPQERLRSLNFGTPDEHLAHSQASVILFFFGYNESYAGAAGLPKYKAELLKTITETKTKNYSGEGPPRMVLVSPIAFEDTGDPNLPDGAERNERLALYTQAMREVAAETGIGFVDLYSSTKSLFESSPARLTLNGFHLNERGYQALATILNNGLFGPADLPQFDSKLHAAIADKNFHWWHRYRAVNGYSIYGKRGAAGSDGTYNNTDVMERERAILDQMTANRDQRIWALAAGESVAEEVDDSNTLPFIEPKTNVGGPDDRQRKLGKLGSLDYLSAEEQAKLFKLAPGYEINLVASEEQFPELANPVALNFDSKGRMWVATMPSYPQWKPKTKLDDKLLILEDHDGDGRADECKVFAGGLHQPTGFELGRGGVYVAQQPDILFLQDTDGDDKEDVRIRRLVGFDTADSHHGISAFEWGPGGGLYFQEGTFKQSQIETLEGVLRLSDAGIWRYDPRTEDFEVHVSFSFANPWGHIFDRWGQNFIADASPGNNYWAAPISGFVPHPDKHPGGALDRALEWGGPKIKKDFPTFIKKRIRPSSGCEIVSSRHFPREAQGNFLLNNVIGERAVLQHRVREDGSGFVGTEIEKLVSGEDGNFRPVDLQFGPDGALYIVDWHNALIGHLQHNLRDPNRDHSHGRIWRVTYKERPLLTPPRIDGASIESLLHLLKAPEDRTRYRARRELAGRDTNEVIAGVQQWVEQLDPSDPGYQHHLLEALWMYQTHNTVNAELLKRLLESPDHRARAAAVRVLTFWRNRLPYTLELVHDRINDSHPRVRLEAVRACSFIHSEKSLEVALDVLNHEMDGPLEYTLVETVRVLEDLLRPASHTMAEHAHHDHGPMGDDPAVMQPKPLVFLDKAPHVVQFQLNRLSPAQLLLVDRSPDDQKSRLVFETILTRPGVSRQDRQEAAAALARMNDSSEVTELLKAIAASSGPAANPAVVRQLTAILLRQPRRELSLHEQPLRETAASQQDSARAAAIAGLVMIGEAERLWQLGESTAKARVDFLTALTLVPDGKLRAELRPKAVESLAGSHPVPVRRAAIRALGRIPTEQEDSFRRVAPLVAHGGLRAEAVRTLLSIPRKERAAEPAKQTVERLIDYAEKTPTAKRTTDNFLEAMHLADELLASLPVDAARQYRNRLREVVVRVVRISTVPEEMRYDTQYFAVEAGRPVQLVLRNDDLMPHNLVLTAPGMLREVAAEAAELGPNTDAQGRQYVPQSPNVLQASRMVASNSQDVMTFTAPREPGEYPYVCTFPNHWMRMYGVMVVVEDLDAWLANPTEPADPLGINRAFVKNWTVDDLPQGDELAEAVAARDGGIGPKIFKEATCAQCHKLHGQGGAVGPDLSEIMKRHNGNYQAVLHEILDPSFKVEPKYALYNVLTVDGKVLSGIVINQNAESITVIMNPEKPQPQVVAREDIEELIKSSSSLMPKGLMDRYTEEEILQLLDYITSPPSSTGNSSEAETESPSEAGRP